MRASPQHGHNGHMKKITVAALKDGLSKHLQYVQRGGWIVVYRRNEPIAELRPLSGASAGQADLDRLKSLERRGVVRMGNGKLDDELKTPPSGKPTGVLAALLEERASGR